MSNDIEMLLDKLSDKSIADIIGENGINILEVDSLPCNTDSMALFTNDIFIRKNLDEYYKKFLILHELGHIFLHYDGSLNFCNTVRLKNKKMEKEANDFACYYLIKDEYIQDINIIELLKSKGVPDNIATQFYDNHEYNKYFSEISSELYLC